MATYPTAAPKELSALCAILVVNVFTVAEQTRLPMILRDVHANVSTFKYSNNRVDIEVVTHINVPRATLTS